MDRKIQFVTNEADERPIYAVFGDILWCRDTGNEYIYDGTAWQEYKIRYKDLGLVIDAVNVAVGSSVISTFFNISRFPEMVAFGGSTDQTHDISLLKRDNINNQIASAAGANNLTAASRAHCFGNSLSGLSASTTAMIGAEVAISIKNSGTAPAIVKMHVTLLNRYI